MITPSDIRRLRDLPIEEVAERLSIHVSRHKSLCPFHDDSVPSLTYYRAKNVYHCFVCGAHGSTIDLVMHMLHKDFKAACEWLGSPLQLPQRGRDLNPGREDKSSPLWGDKRGAFSPSRYSRFFEHPWLSPEANRFLYDERHLDPRVIRWCRLNSYQDRRGDHWLQIPYFDIDGRLIGVQNRNLDYSKSVFPSSSLGGTERGSRFRFPAGSRCCIYNLQILSMLKPDDELYIAEGCSDCWALLSSGHKAIAIPSATLLKPQDLQPIKDLGPRIQLHMYPDQDAPGARLYLQLKDHLPRLIHHQLPEGCKDYSDFWLLNR